MNLNPINWLRSLWRRAMTNYILVPVDSKYSKFIGPKNIKVEGEILGKYTKIDKKTKELSTEVLSTRRVGTSDVLTVPFSNSVGKYFIPHEVLEKDGRRTLIYREVFKGENPDEVF